MWHQNGTGDQVADCVAVCGLLEIDSQWKMRAMAISGTEPVDELTATLAAIRTESGVSLLALAERSPILLVFLRHFGCSFCRKAISDVAELRDKLAELGVRPVFVHLGTTEIAKAHFDFYGLNEVERINDPGAAIYQHPAFALRRVNPWWHLVNPAVWAGWLRRMTTTRFG